MFRHSFRSQSCAIKCRRFTTDFYCNFFDNSSGQRYVGAYFSFDIEIIRRLTIYEKDYTETYRQASLLIKSVVAQMINTILIPIITAYYVKNKNFYYQNGLVDNIFMLSITTIIVPPILLIINPYRIAMGLYRCYMSSTGNIPLI